MKYIILSDSDNVEPFQVPRQLLKFNGESLIERTIRLLKENGVKDIVITSHDKRFDDLGAVRYEPQYNDYRPRQGQGYWLSAFPIELLNEPITFLFGDCYYSKMAIETIVKSNAESVLYFCSYKNKDSRYIKHHDEPFAFKVVDCELFLKHINIVKKMFDEGKTVRHPIAWELYRSINGINFNTHIMTNNYIAINDESCDIDRIDDIILLEKMIGGNDMIKMETVVEFTLQNYAQLKNIQRKSIDTKGKLYVGDIFECDKNMADYLSGNNDKKIVVARVIEVKPDTNITKQEKPVAKKPTTKKTKKSTTKKSTKKSK